MDLVGKRFGKLVVVSYAYSANGVFWNCHCDCGNDVVVSTSHLNHGQVSCGCMEGNRKDLTGKKFGRLIVLFKKGYCTYPNGNSAVTWDCLCDCGNHVIATTNQLTSGNTKSCGCYHKDAARDVHLVHGDRCRNKYVRLYSIWKSMRGRCNIPTHTSYPYYGARGIRVCSEWSDYSVFKDWALSTGYTDELTIDRIDSNGDYGPDNCRWIPKKEQACNKGNNHYIIIDDERHTLAEWSRRMGLSGGIIWGRLKRGWSERDAIMTPVLHSKNKNVVSKGVQYDKK